MDRHNMLGQRIRIAILAAALPAGPALAAQLEEVVVTAQRRAENLQDVPLAITALGQDSIEKADIRDLTDIATRVPGLSFSPFSPGQNILSLRGASSNDDGAGTDNSIAVFIDDVYLGRVSNVNPEMFDIERIEVLRGPQGTLYGKNTIGGAINVVSTRPNTEELEGKVRFSLGNYDRRDLAGLLTGPIAERWAAKGSFSLRKRDGWVDNVFLGKKQKDDDSQAYRGQLMYHGDRFEAMFSADYDRLDVEDMARVPIATGEPGDPAFWAADVPGSYAELCAGRGPSCSANPVDGYAKREAGGVIAGDFVVINQTFSNSVSESWSAFTPKAALAFDINDTSRVYASIAKGFKSSGFAAALPPPIGSDNHAAALAFSGSLCLSSRAYPSRRVPRCQQVDPRAPGSSARGRSRRVLREPQPTTMAESAGGHSATE